MEGVPVACLVWLNRSANTKYVSSLWLCDSEALASPMSEDWCHDTSASNVYIVAWQKIVKPKALELGVIVCTRYCEMEWSGWPGVMCRTCFSPFKPCLKLRARSSISVLWKRIHVKSPYCSWSENWWMHFEKASATSLCFSNNFLDPIFSLSNIRVLSNSSTPGWIMNVTSLNSAIWLACTLQSAQDKVLYGRVARLLLNFSERGLGTRLYFVVI